jgi:hypothetical protein
LIRSDQPSVGNDAVQGASSGLAFVGPESVRRARVGIREPMPSPIRRTL